MSKITICRTTQALPADMAPASALLFKVFDGFNRDDKSAWRRFWKRLLKLEPGEMAVAEMVFPRSGPYHRRHMKIEQTIFDAQERFENFNALRDWLKIGAGHCEWVPGPRGAVVPIPKSISYASIDDQDFRVFHENTIKFLREPRSANVLWPHLKGERAAEMMDTILRGFEE